MEIDIPDNIRTFIDEVVDSFAIWDLLIFLSKSESEVETSKWVSQMLGRPVEEVSLPVQKLVKLGLLLEVALPEGEKGFQLKRDSARFPTLKGFWDFNDSQENRLRILSYLLQKKTR